METTPKPKQAVPSGTTAPIATTRQSPSPVPSSGAPMAVMITVSGTQQTHTVIYGQGNQAANKPRD